MPHRLFHSPNAQLVLSARDIILANPPDFPTIHTLLLKLPKQLGPEESENMVQRALELFERVGPYELQRHANHYLPSQYVDVLVLVLVTLVRCLREPPSH